MCRHHIEDEKVSHEINDRLDQLYLYKCILKTQLGTKYREWTLLDSYAQSSPDKLISDLIAINEFELSRRVIVLLSPKLHHHSLKIKVEAANVLKLLNDKQGKTFFLIFLTF